MNIAVDSGRRMPRIPRARARIGDLLLAAGALREKDIARIVALQRERHRRFGELALELKLVTEAQLSCALAKQIDFPMLAYGQSTLAHTLAAAYDPFGSYSEALRTLRSQLLMRWFDSEHKTLAVTAAHRGDGCTSVAANLAIVFSQLGQSTLLIDADLRHPEQHRLFGLSASTGLTDLLYGQCEAEQALQPIAPFDTLMVMAGGAPPPNPQEILSSSRFVRLLDELSQQFDVILIDTPPLLECADAAIIAGRTGGCLLSARRHRTPVEDLRRARASLRPTDTAVVGAVINE